MNNVCNNPKVKESRYKHEGKNVPSHLCSKCVTVMEKEVSRGDKGKKMKNLNATVVTPCAFSLSLLPSYSH